MGLSFRTCCFVTALPLEPLGSLILIVDDNDKNHLPLARNSCL